MNQREKVLLIITVIVMFGGGLYAFGLGDFINGFSQRAEEVTDAEEKFKDAILTLQNAGAIIDDFNKVGSAWVIKPEEGKKPGLMLTEEINKLCRSLNIKINRLEPASAEEIEGTYEYEFITVGLRTEGKLSTIIKLLKAFEQKRYLFRDIDLTGTRDRDRISARIAVARIAGVPEKEAAARKQAQKKRKKRKKSKESF